MPSRFANFIVSWRAVAGIFSFRRRNRVIDSLESLEDFVATRAAFVAQKTLYGYLKTRIGTRYPRMFEEEVFVQSVNIAKFHVFAACLSDLAIYATAHAFKETSVSANSRQDLALKFYRRAMADNICEAPAEFSSEDSIQTFAKRLVGTDWAAGALHRHNFNYSPAALSKWAPIAPELKDDDTEIIENSIKFAWRDIREQYQKRLQPEDVVNDWLAQSQNAG